MTKKELLEDIEDMPMGVDKLVDILITIEEETLC